MSHASSLSIKEKEIQKKRNIKSRKIDKRKRKILVSRVFHNIHHFLEYFVILVCLAFFTHACLIFDANRLTISLSLSLSVKLEVLRFFIIVVASLTKTASSSLFFGIKSLDKWIFSSTIGIDTVREA